MDSNQKYAEQVKAEAKDIAFFQKIVEPALAEAKLKVPDIHLVKAGIYNEGHKTRFLGTPSISLATRTLRFHWENSQLTCNRGTDTPIKNLEPTLDAVKNEVQAFLDEANGE